MVFTSWRRMWYVLFRSVILIRIAMVDRISLASLASEIKCFYCCLSVCAKVHGRSVRVSPARCAGHVGRLGGSTRRGGAGGAGVCSRYKLSSHKSIYLIFYLRKTETSLRYSEASKRCDHSRKCETMLLQVFLTKRKIG